MDGVDGALMLRRQQGDGGRYAAGDLTDRDHGGLVDGLVIVGKRAFDFLRDHVREVVLSETGCLHLKSVHASVFRAARSSFSHGRLLNFYCGKRKSRRQ